MTALRLAAWLAALPVLLVVASCGTSQQDELQDWMQQQRQVIRPRVTPIPEPKKFTPQPYTQGNAFDPFSNQKLTQALRREATQPSASTALVLPELSRRKEPLESYPLDTVVMVGSLARQGQPVALLRVDNLLYQVRLGNYVGQNYGKVIKVDETELVLREIVQDAAGEWIERTATLRLQERAR